MPDPGAPQNRFFAGFPAGCADMSDEEKNEACAVMADEVHHQLGIGRYAEDGDD